MDNLICSPCYMVITELELSHSEATISQEKEVIKKMYKVFFKNLFTNSFCGHNYCQEIVLGKDTQEKEF